MNKYLSSIIPTSFYTSQLNIHLNTHTFKQPFVRTCLLTGILLSLSGCGQEQPNAAAPKAQTIKNDDAALKENTQNSKQVPFLSPEDSLKTITIQDGYKMEIVAAEPLIEEPVLFTFDGNGRMYVAEMLTYMQDADATGQMQPISRIKQLRDTDNDGVMDTATIFADNLLLPRMIQPLQDGKIIVRETNTFDLWLYEDTNNDGISDKKERIYEGGRRGGNMEHQPSGLIYNIDNWMYVTYTDKRYKFKDGKIITSDLAYGGGQWGLGQDHTGRLFYSSAGGENPAFGFQYPIAYGKIGIKGELTEGFKEVFPLDNTPDVQGGPRRFREDGTLNHFTGVGGQSVYLGDKLPELYGYYIAPEPVGNLVRKAKLTRENGHTIISHPYQADKTEFIAATDPNFRPIWSDTAPDGTLMILDMYRGIIQESNWTKKGSYLRGVIEEYGFDKIIGGGRIYRVTRDGVTLGEQPNFYQQSPQKLVQHLAHPNHWWRINAQKLIVLEQDKSVVPSLIQMAKSHANPLARLHALWTLEGLEVLDKTLLTEKFTDADSDVRVAAIRISEQLFSEQDQSIVKAWQNTLKSADLELTQQIVLSAFYINLDDATRNNIKQIAQTRFANSISLKTIAENMQFLLAEKAKFAKLAAGDAELAAAIKRGEKNYKSLCYTCHAEDGSGTPMGDGLIAPSFHNSKNVSGDIATLGRIVTHGLMGPIDGVTYGGGIMASLGSNDDEWVADVLTYIRNNFGNQASRVKAEHIATIKTLEEGRSMPWTQAELVEQFGTLITDKSGWTVTASHGMESIDKLTDGTVQGRWSSVVTQTPGMWLQVELPEVYKISRVNLVNQFSKNNYPRGYTLEFSIDGKTWQTVDENLNSGFELFSDTLGRHTKFIKITVINGTSDKNWQMNELDLFGSPAQ